MRAFILVFLSVLMTASCNSRRYGHLTVSSTPSPSKSVVASNATDPRDALNLKNRSLSTIGFEVPSVGAVRSKIGPLDLSIAHVDAYVPTAEMDEGVQHAPVITYAKRTGAPSREGSSDNGYFVLLVLLIVLLLVVLLVQVFPKAAGFFGSFGCLGWFLSLFGLAVLIVLIILLARGLPG